MTRRTIQELINQANASLPDNTAEAISPADVRNMVVDFLDTMAPMYGGLTTVTRTLNLTTTPQLLPFDAEISSFPPEWTVNAAAGTIARNLVSVAAMTSKVFVGGTCEGPQGSELIVQLFKNNVATQWRTEETMEGPTKSVGFNFAAIDYGQENAVYKLMVSASGNAAMTVRDVIFIGENIPVREVPAVGKVG